MHKSNFSNIFFAKPFISFHLLKVFFVILAFINKRGIFFLFISKIKTELNNKLDSDFLIKIENRKIWCSASTHPTEEILCAKSHLKIKEKYKNILTIIIPRHIDRIKTIYEELSKLNLKIVLSSNLGQVDAKTDVILVDSYGESLKFYNISKYVFLGKSLATSLRKDSGQNPIEPARLGCKIFHGPYVSNFMEIYKYLNELGVTKEINSSDELSLSLVEEFKDDKPIKLEISAKIENYGQNILNNVTMEIKKYI